VNELPQEQVTCVSMYSGWMPSFTAGSLRGGRRVVNLST
jgi:hypothetical protein